MKKFVVIAFSVGLLLMSSSIASAQDCGKGREILKKLQGAVEKVLDEVGCHYIQAQTGTPAVVCKKGAKVIHKLEKKMNAALRKLWKKMVKNSWATIGPRDLQWDKTNSGTLVGLGGRMFVAQTPSHEQTITIKIKKYDGRAKAGVAICVRDLVDKKFKILKKHSFKKGSQKASFKYTIKNAVGKIIMVHLKGKSLAKKFKYLLMAGDAGTAVKAARTKAGKKAVRKAVKKVKNKVKKGAKKVKNKVEKGAKKVKNKVKKGAKKVKNKVKKFVNKVKCRAACNKKKKRKDRRNCKKKCK
ncbi:MAG TPA: hypothetical protein EYN06_10505 [Myxococcales bacterium]|nr:hypothetical protein [Myxococcales bacterium]